MQILDCRSVVAAAKTQYIKICCKDTSYDVMLRSMSNKHMNPRGIRLKKDFLKTARQPRALTQTALAELAGVSTMNVWRAENAHSIDLENAKKITDALGLELADGIEEDVEVA